jgi:DNA-binding beta-propeller fold protein YncE
MPTANRRLLTTVVTSALVLAALTLTGPGATGRAFGATGSQSGTRDVLFVANNWDGTADVIDPHSFARLARIDIIPDKAERLAEIQLNPVAHGYFLGIRELVGEGHDQFADDMFSSHDGRFLYVSRPSFADVVAFDLQSRRIVWRAKVEGYRADHMAISPDGRRLVVSASTARKAHVIDAHTGRIVGSFESGDQPHENNFSADGRRIFHASIGAVYTPLDEPAFDSTKGDRWFEVVDAQTLRVLKRIDIGKKLAEAGFPNMSSAVRPMAIAPGERYFYFQLSFLHGFVEYDLQEDRPLRIANLPLSEEAQRMRREQYLLDSAHHGLAMNPEGTKLCAAGTMSDYAAIVSRQTFAYRIIPVGQKPYWATNSGDGRYCFVSVSGEDRVSVISYAEEREVARIPVGDHPQRMRMGTVRVADLRAAGCADRVAPRSWVERRRSTLSRGGVVVRGRASDACDGRSPGRVDRVLVSVGRLEGRGRCRFVRPDGRLGATRSCYRPVFRRASGGARWALRVARRLPPGLYQAHSQAVDAAGNRELSRPRATRAERRARRRTPPRNLMTFRLR